MAVPIPTLTEIGYFGIELMVIWIMYNLGGWIRELFKYKKLQVILKNLDLEEKVKRRDKSVIERELDKERDEDLQKPDTPTEIVRRSLGIFKVKK